MSLHPRLPGRVGVAIAAVAAAIAVWSACDGWPTALTHLRDDAYYEFVWACNLFSARGPTVSDGVTTSGVQPLWCLLLGYLCNAQWRAVEDFAVVLGVACHLGAALLWLGAGRGRPAARVAALLWLGNPLLLRECQNGQETALACLLATALWLGRRRTEVWFAVLAVLAVLARTELWLLVVALAIVRLRRHRAAALVAPAASAAVLVAFDLACGGGVLPDSALPMAFLAHANFAATVPGLAEQLAQSWWYLRPVLLGHPYPLGGGVPFAALGWLVLQPLWPRSLRAVPTLLVALAALVGVGDLWLPLAIAALLWWRPRATARRPRPALLALLLATVAIVLLHWGLRWHPRDYYAAPLAVGGAAALLRLSGRGWLLPALAALQLAWQLLVPLPAEPLRHQRAMQVAGVVAQRLLPPDARVGSFNAGLLTFAQRLAGLDGARIVNLDGVVDRRAFDALRQRRLGAFLDAHDVHFLFDNPVQWSLDPRLPHACGQWFGAAFDPGRDLVELVRCVEPGVDAGRPGTDAFVCCWRRGSDAPPGLPDAPVELGRLTDGAPVVLWQAAAGQVLEAELAAGRRAVLLQADRAARFALAPRLPPGATGRLFTRGRAEPVLVLDAPR